MLNGSVQLAVEVNSAGGGVEYHMGFHGGSVLYRYNSVGLPEPGPTA